MKKYKKILFKGLKIALGSSVAIYIATLLKLDYAISAGTITLLTIVSTKWDTVKLSLFRLITLVATIFAAWIIFTHVPNVWIAYGVFVFFVVILCEWLGWGATISVNAVVGAHLLTTMQFDLEFIINEAFLVLIGITLAIVLNLFNDNKHTKKDLIAHMRYVESQLQAILQKLAQYLYNQEMPRSVWDDIISLEESIRQYIADAREYQDNTFHSHPGYYIDYFAMRLQQCTVLHNLHYEMKHIRNMPAQARIIANYILYMSKYVIEINTPTKQLDRLKQIFNDMKNEPLPESYDEFESRAILYHILMDLEDFLISKRRFVHKLNGQQRNIYWKNK
ncbi:MAG: hypothetical protein J1G06_01840 [Oscillospiraceae bacterium]|nr:hypothetical protein [Oscillospiraceae bacterium]